MSATTIAAPATAAPDLNNQVLYVRFEIRTSRVTLYRFKEADSDCVWTVPTYSTRVQGLRTGFPERAPKVRSRPRALQSPTHSHTPVRRIPNRRRRVAPARPWSAPTPPNDSSDLHFRYLLITQSFQVRFGRSMVQTTRTVRGSSEHSPSSPPDTVSTNLKHQRNYKSILLLDGRVHAAHARRGDLHHLPTRSICVFLTMNIGRFLKRERERESHRTHARTFELSKIRPKSRHSLVTHPLFTKTEVQIALAQSTSEPISTCSTPLLSKNGERISGPTPSANI